MSFHPNHPHSRALLVSLAMWVPAIAGAHFQEIIPSHDILTQATGPRLHLSLTFTHPMEGGPLMPMGMPVRFGVVGPQGDSDLKPRLKPVQQAGGRSYAAEYKVSRPGDYTFYIEPAPYWEPAERVMIIHYAKVVVDAFGAEQGWAREVGLPVEIVPLTPMDSGAAISFGGSSSATDSRCLMPRWKWSGATTAVWCHLPIRISPR